MSRSGRRRTLCHSEIENFLSEIPTIVRSSQCQPSGGSHSNMHTTEEEMLRRYCKMMFAEKNDDRAIEEYFQIARNVFKGSNYRLLSTRLIHPELFEFPSSSLEAKKALLLSLSPMLKEAEEQKKKDSAACESFTRCRSAKGKGSYGVYEYIDVDTQLRVEFPDFERRYMMFIGNTKTTNKALNVERKQPQQQQLQPLVQAVLVESSALQASVSLPDSYKENVATHHNYSFSEGLSLSPSQIIRKEKSSVRPSRAAGAGSKQSERRITLSPATAKALLLSALDDDKDITKSSSNEGGPHALANVDLNTVTKESSTTSTPLRIVSSADSTVPTGSLSSNQAEVIKSLGKELDGILANFDDCPLTTGTNLLQPCSNELLMVDDFLFDDSASFHIAPCSPVPVKCDPSVQTEYFHATNNNFDKAMDPVMDKPDSSSFKHGYTTRRASYAFPIATSKSSSSKRRNSMLGVVPVSSVEERVEEIPQPKHSSQVEVEAATAPVAVESNIAAVDSTTIAEGTEVPEEALSNHNVDILREFVAIENFCCESENQTIVLGDHTIVDDVNTTNPITIIEEFENSSRTVPVLVDENIANTDVDMTDTEEVRIEFSEPATTQPQPQPLLDSQLMDLDGPRESSLTAEVGGRNASAICENASDNFLPTKIIDEVAAKDHAFARMCERFEVARWKFRWEQVSVTAANFAWLRQTRPKHS